MPWVVNPEEGNAKQVGQGTSGRARDPCKGRFLLRAERGYVLISSAYCEV